MSKTDKDQPYQRKQQAGRSEPSWWRNGEEPMPRYRGDREWYW